MYVCTYYHFTCSFSDEPAKYEGDTESSFVSECYPGPEDVLYRDNRTRSANTQEEEFRIRLFELFITTIISNSAHKPLSLSESGKQISDTVL